MPIDRAAIADMQRALHYHATAGVCSRKHTLLPPGRRDGDLEACWTVEQRRRVCEVGIRTRVPFAFADAPCNFLSSTTYRVYRVCMCDHDASASLRLPFKTDRERKCARAS